MKWKEFKEGWKQLDKKRKNEIVLNTLAEIASAILIICGCHQMSEYIDLIPPDHRYAIGGAFITSVGFFAFWYFCWKYDRGIFARIEDRIEKLEEKHAQEVEKCENNRA